jgi:acylphosphatase
MGDKKQEAGLARLHAVVHGRVQGVSFRYYTQKRANELNLSGYVRNKWDGTVEVVAEGRRGDLEEILSFLHEGPRSAFVTQVAIEWAAPSGDFHGFGVRY